MEFFLSINLRNSNPASTITVVVVVVVVVVIIIIIIIIIVDTILQTSSNVIPLRFQH